uniref:Polynucleotide adenylyltransferase n=1 Tax=Eutreptiella gymnastica TaxID=73025 RepID=A0A7S1NBM9_9EUGL
MTAIPVWMKPSLNYGNNTVSRFSQEILDFVRFMELSPAEKHKRNHVVEQVRGIVVSLWPGISVDIFGSWVCGLCLPSSDVDLTINSTLSIEAISPLVSALQVYGFKCKFLAHATVPIIKFTHLETGVRGDISFGLVNATRSARLVQEFLQVYPAAKPLTIVIKTILRGAGLNNVYSGGLSSYAITLLVISFLQMHPYYKLPEARDRYALSDLLIDFLIFYGKDFNYHSTALSVLNGGQYCVKQPNQEQSLLLSIIDPLDASNDVCKGSFSISSVRELFYGHYIKLEKCKWSKPMSMLSSIFSVQMLVQRRLITVDRCVTRFMLPSGEVPVLVSVGHVFPHGLEQDVVDGYVEEHRSQQPVGHGPTPITDACGTSTQLEPAVGPAAQHETQPHLLPTTTTCVGSSRPVYVAHPEPLTHPLPDSRCGPEPEHLCRTLTYDDEGVLEAAADVSMVSVDTTRSEATTASSDCEAAYHLLSSAISSLPAPQEGTGITVIALREAEVCHAIAQYRRSRNSPRHSGWSRSMDTLSTPSTPTSSIGASNCSSEDLGVPSGRRLSGARRATMSHGAQSAPGISTIGPTYSGPLRDVKSAFNQVADRSKKTSTLTDKSSSRSPKPSADGPHPSGATAQNVPPRPLIRAVKIR